MYPDDARVVPPRRQVRAVFDRDTLTVYQAYSPAIAEAALAAGRLVSPFKFDRMTWIKPSFLWMMYRSGWATKPGQERILAIRITRAGFEEALSEACLSHFDSDVHSSHSDWLRQKKASPVRVQWDPERSIYLEGLPWRSIQIGLSGTPAHSFATQWTVDITDITDSVRELHRLVQAGESDVATSRLPKENPYPLPVLLRTRLHAS